MNIIIIYNLNLTLPLIAPTGFVYSIIIYDYINKNRSIYGINNIYLKMFIHIDELISFILEKNINYLIPVFIKSVKFASKYIQVPFIILGGAGKFDDFIEANKVNKEVSLGAANIFHFTEHSILNAKKFLSQSKMNVRTF